MAVMAALSSIRIDAQSDDCRGRVLQQLCSTSSLQQMTKLSAQTLILYDLSLTAVDYSLVARYRMEMTSFCAVLWETLLLLCAAAQDTHLALACREKLVAEFAKRLQVLCSPGLQEGGRRDRGIRSGESEQSHRESSNCIRLCQQPPFREQVRHAVEHDDRPGCQRGGHRRCCEREQERCARHRSEGL